MDYKVQLPKAHPDDRREFLYDVSSFANAAGGDIVFGIADERDSSGKATGIPASAEGIKVENLSSEILRLENLVRDGIDPRIAGIEWLPIDGFPNGTVLVMRVPKSWVAPHMVTFGGVSRFYSRNNAGKYPLNVGEIRSAFLASSAAGESLRGFRLERIAKALEDDLPLPLGQGFKILLHLVPLSALDPTNVRDVATGTGQQNYVKLRPLGADGAWNYRYNFDGWMAVVPGMQSYVQLFRSGVIEAGEGELFKWVQESQGIPTTALEDVILRALPRFLDVQKELGISLPITVLLTLVGAKGLVLHVPRRFSVFSHIRIDRDILPIPEVMIESYDILAHTLLRPVFDAMWQSGGFEKSFNYNDKGEWTARD